MRNNVSLDARGHDAYPGPLLAGLFDQPVGFRALSLAQTEALHFFIESHVRRELVEGLGRVCAQQISADAKRRQCDVTTAPQ